MKNYNRIKSGIVVDKSKAQNYGHDQSLPSKQYHKVDRTVDIIMDKRSSNDNITKGIKTMKEFFKGVSSNEFFGGLWDGIMTIPKLIISFPLLIWGIIDDDWSMVGWVIGFLIAVVSFITFMLYVG